MNKDTSSKILLLHPWHQKWLGDFLQNLIRGEKSPLTIQSYRSDLVHFLSWFELTTGHLIARVNASHIAEYQNYLKTALPAPGRRHRHPFFTNLLIWRRAHRYHRPHPSLQLEMKRALGPNTRKRRLSALKKFFDYLGEIHRVRGERLFERHPVSQTLHHIKLKDAAISHTKLLSASAYEALAKRLVYPEERLLVRLLYHGGLRIREAAALKFSDFNPQNETLTFIRKGGSRHTLALSHFGEIHCELERVKVRQVIASDYIFAAGKRAGPLSTRALYNRIKKYLRQAGLGPELAPHSFRKGCATNLYQKTRDLLFVRDYLNHQNALVTQTYIETSGQKD